MLFSRFDPGATWSGDQNLGGKLGGMGDGELRNSAHLLTIRGLVLFSSFFTVLGFLAALIIVFIFNIVFAGLATVFVAPGSKYRFEGYRMTLTRAQLHSMVFQSKVASRGGDSPPSHNRPQPS
jgi:hypothetical protein